MVTLRRKTIFVSVPCQRHVHTLWRPVVGMTTHCNRGVTLNHLPVLVLVATRTATNNMDVVGTLNSVGCSKPEERYKKYLSAKQ